MNRPRPVHFVPPTHPYPSRPTNCSVMKILIRPLCLFLLLSIHHLAYSQVPALSSYPSAPAVIFLDFDGHTVAGTAWNWSGPIACAPSGLNSAQITEVFNRVAEDYRPFNINITTDSTQFLAVPSNRRTRIIITVTSSWYGSSAGGVALTGSFSFGDDSPGFVFSALFGYNIKKIAEGASHEAGHTLGLYHQAKYDSSCNFVTEYNTGQGSGEIGWAPIMGAGYYQNFTLWNLGPSMYGCDYLQNDLEIITSPFNGFGYRVDDHGSSFATAAVPTFTSNHFNATGVIEQNTDQDYFQFIMPAPGRFQLEAIPYNVGTGNAGSDLDLQVSLYDQSHTVLSVYNPGALLNSVADTILDAGNYFLKVEGKGNLYAPSYASLGSYSLQASIDPGGTVLPLHHLALHGVRNGDKHQLSWSVEADEQIEQQVLEVSTDGRTFTTLTEVAAGERSYIYRPEVTSPRQYRLNVTFKDGHRYYSNTVSIFSRENDPRPKLVGNLIQTNSIYISSPASYSYTILDLNGQTLAAGQLTNGINHIEIRHMTAGIYFVRFTGNDQQWTDKLVRQ